MNMRLYLSLLMLSFLVCTLGTAQYCEFLLKPQDIVANKAFCSFTSCDDSTVIYRNFPIEDIAFKTLKLRWVLFEDADGTNSIQDSFIVNYMDVLNEVFEPHRYRFSLFSIENEIDNEVNHASRTMWEDSISFYRSYVKNTEDIVNILVTKEFGNSGSSAFATFPFNIPELDYETFPERRGVVVITQRLLDPNFQGYLGVIPHEFGHLFGLFHVDFLNSNCNQLCNETIDPENNKYSLLPYNSGDFIKDTNPMARFTDLYDFQDICLDPIDTMLIDDCTGLAFYDQFPNMQNYMSNYLGCHNHFTEEQALRMHCFVETYYPNYIDNELTDLVDLDSDETLTLFPNPAVDFIQLDSNLNSLFENYSIYSYEGVQVVGSQKSMNNRISIEHLASGIYFILINTTNQNHVYRFIKL